MFAAENFFWIGMSLMAIGTLGLLALPMISRWLRRRMFRQIDADCQKIRAELLKLAEIYRQVETTK